MFILFIVVVVDTGVGTQNFTLARQALYHLSHASSPFSFALVIFQILSSIFAYS
jgi:hypothetical protein